MNRLLSIQRIVRPSILLENPMVRPLSSFDNKPKFIRIDNTNKKDEEENAKYTKTDFTYDIYFTVSLFGGLGKCIYDISQEMKKQDMYRIISGGYNDMDIVKAGITGFFGGLFLVAFSPIVLPIYYSAKLLKNYS